MKTRTLALGVSMFGHVLLLGAHARHASAQEPKVLNPPPVLLGEVDLSSEEFGIQRHVIPELNGHKLTARIVTRYPGYVEDPTFLNQVGRHAPGMFLFLKGKTLMKVQGRPDKEYREGETLTVTKEMKYLYEIPKGGTEPAVFILVEVVKPRP